MKHVKLGRSGLRVSRLALGTYNFGEHTPYKEAYAILDYALENGVNFLDTSNSYGLGVSESMIGSWLKDIGPALRDQMIISTKVYWHLTNHPNNGGLSAYHIRRACENSLKALEIDHIDVYTMHHVDRDVPWEEIWQAMDLLIQQGKISYVGSSNFAAWHIVQAQNAAEKRNMFGLVSEQGEYNFRNRLAELELFPCCRELGIGMMTYSPMGSGLFCGDGEMKKGQRQDVFLDFPRKSHEPQLIEYTDLCHELGVKPAQLALAWVMSKSDVTSVITGPRTLEQFKQNLYHHERPISVDVQKRINQIWPGVGEAPEAYAW